MFVRKLTANNEQCIAAHSPCFCKQFFVWQKKGFVPYLSYLWIVYNELIGCAYRLLEEQDTVLSIKLVLKSGSKKMLKVSASIIGATIYIVVNGKCTHFCIYGWRCQKYASHKKKLLIKVVCNWISYKKVYERIYLSPTRVKLVALKDWHVRSIIQ